MTARWRALLIMLWVTTTAAGLTGAMNGGVRAASLVPEQAARGKAAYSRSCSGCHRTDLSGDQNAPALSGDAFAERWAGQTVADLFDNVQTGMPMDNPGGLSDTTFIDIVVYLLEQNGYPVEGELTADRDALRKLTIRSK
jgi:mono/diheme cytochrome c family protein